MIGGMIGELLARVLAEPDDLGTRAVYADALTLAGDPRGELIALGCELASAGTPTVDALVASPLAGAELVRRAGQLRRANQLIAEHAAAWLMAAHEPVLAGGFIDRLKLYPGTGAELATFAEVLAREPVRALILMCDAEAARAVCALPVAHVRRLALHGDAIDELPALLAAMPGLTHLELQSARPEQLRALGALRSLVELELQHASTAALEALAVLPNAGQLQRVDLGCSSSVVIYQVDDPLRALEGAFPGAVEIGLHNLSITDEHLCERRALQFPARLNLARNRFGARGLAALAAQPAAANLRALDVSMMRMGADAVAAVLAGPHTDNLVELDAGWLGASDGMGGVIASAGQRLRRLRLGRTELGEDAVARIIAAHSLESLLLSDCGDSAAIARAIAGADRACSLRELSLFRMPLGDAGATALASSEHLANLRALSLDATGLTDHGVHAIATSPHLAQLVRLQIRQARVRSVLELCALPALVELANDPYGDSVSRAATRAHFGVGQSSDSPAHMTYVLFAGKPLSHARAEEILRAAGFRVKRVRGKAILELDDSAFDLSIFQSRDDLAIAATPLAGPERARAIVKMHKCVYFEVTAQQAAGPDAPALAAAARVLATALDGVVWDRYEDALFDPTAP